MRSKKRYLFTFIFNDLAIDELLGRGLAKKSDQSRELPKLWQFSRGYMLPKLWQNRVNAMMLPKLWQFSSKENASSNYMQLNEAIRYLVINDALYRVPEKE